MNNLKIDNYKSCDAYDPPSYMIISFTASENTLIAFLNVSRHLRITRPVLIASGA